MNTKKAVTIYLDKSIIIMLKNLSTNYHYTTQSGLITKLILTEHEKQTNPSHNIPNS